VLLSSLLETQQKIPKLKDIDKSNIRNFTLLPIFTDSSRGGTADIGRIAKHTTQNTSTRGTGNHTDTDQTADTPSRPAGHWTGFKKKPGDSIKLILSQLLSEAQHQAQRPFAPEEAMRLETLFQIPKETEDYQVDFLQIKQFQD